jgi:hypothetical protein
LEKFENLKALLTGDNAVLAQKAGAYYSRLVNGQDGSTT